MFDLEREIEKNSMNVQKFDSLRKMAEVAPAALQEPRSLKPVVASAAVKEALARGGAARVPAEKKRI